MDAKTKAAVDALTDHNCCPLCNYGGFWFVDPRTGRNEEIDDAALVLVEKIKKIVCG